MVDFNRIWTSSLLYSINKSLCKVRKNKMYNDTIIDFAILSFLSIYIYIYIFCNRYNVIKLCLSNLVLFGVFHFA